MILDVGCGSHPKGDVNLDLLVPDSDWDCNDCEAYAKQIPNFIKADAHHLPFKDNAFDVVYSSHLLEHVENDKAVLAEMRRVSRREIRIVVPFSPYILLELWLLMLTTRSSKRLIYLRRHHKCHYGLNPFHAKHVKLNYIKKLKSFKLRELRLPIPLETETQISFHVHPK